MDYVTAESIRAGQAAARYVLGGVQPEGSVLPVEAGAGVSYVVPQRIRPAQVDKAVEFFFRVRQNMGPSRILVTQDGETVARFQRDRMAPGEMEHVRLPKQLLKGSRALQITVEEVQV